LLHRDGMAKKDWLRLVAVHSDAWLVSLAMGYFASQLDRETRYTALAPIARGPHTVAPLEGRFVQFLGLMRCAG